ncbi:MAG TPA: aminotransferase class III-fold pyridoxal phosphate-dependent enzyme [Pirellula sp.]|nr:aminotransferase class III-fold pyridoxal phosphate-dependent enzyme [Pirellula sp.]
MSSTFHPVGAGRSHDPHANLVFKRGSGHRVWDTAGRVYIDFIGGYSSLNLGHAHPALLAVAQEQLKQLTFCTGGNSPWRAELEQALVGVVSRSLLPGGTVQLNSPARQAGPTMGKTWTSPKVWLSTTGARAVEVAWKVAFANRPGGLMRFDLGYHGRSLATSLISDTQRSSALTVFSQLEETRLESDGVVPYPRCGSQCDGHCLECSASISAAQSWLERNGQTTSAMIMEPAIGARGYYFASGEYYRRLVSLLREHDLLVISDEIQMGLGRLGFMVASHAQGWIPDLIVFGKSLGGGITPISAVIGDAIRMDRLGQGIESETFAANPLACKIAIETLYLLNDAIMLDRVRLVGNRFRQWLQRSLPNECRVDGRGLCTAIDLSSFGDESAEVTRRWVCQLREQGVLVHLTGAQRDRVAILPPLNVDEETLWHVANILSRTWKDR